MSLEKDPRLADQTPHWHDRAIEDIVTLWKMSERERF